MALDPSMLVFFQDAITVEPWTGESGARAPTFAAAVTYPGMVRPWVGRSIVGHDGREFQPLASVGIPNRVSIDPRSRVTLPSDMLIAGTRQPPIRAVRPGPASTLNLDYTELIF